MAVEKLNHESYEPGNSWKISDAEEVVALAEKLTPQGSKRWNNLLRFGAYSGAWISTGLALCAIESAAIPYIQPETMLPQWYTMTMFVTGVTGTLHGLTQVLPEQWSRRSSPQ